MRTIFWFMYGQRYSKAAHLALAQHRPQEEMMGLWKLAIWQLKVEKRRQGWRLFHEHT